MKILFNKELKEYKRYLKDRDSFLKEEKDKLKIKLKEYCKVGKHKFEMVYDEGIIIKSCLKCPLTVKE